MIFGWYVVVGRLVWRQTTVLWFENQKGRILQKLTTSLWKNQTATAFGNTYCVSLRCSKPLNLILIFGPNKFSFVWHNRDRERTLLSLILLFNLTPEKMSLRAKWDPELQFRTGFPNPLQHRDHLCLLAHNGTNAVFSTEVLLEKRPALWSHVKRLQHCSQTRRTQPLYCSLFLFFILFYFFKLFWCFHQYFMYCYLFQPLPSCFVTCLQLHVYASFCKAL